jgi:hypothetical protein
MAAKEAGLSFDALVCRVVEVARARYGRVPGRRSGSRRPPGGAS